ncbi:VRR-NUC domain-containing protein [Paraburkholderia bannensis]|uniref:VRR-NUC domain-containing protein n=1 Tax=Paraburkholderia bannensis TaxID=765414 RepID=UPI002AB5F034|nr:VRR-NUC domain-containing protein [Paraburkholderia bannensis]
MSRRPKLRHSDIRQWIREIWKDKPTKYKSCEVRRPDVVIVSDPSQPPVQSNIKTVVEMKFPPDRINRTQELAYIDIAGGDVSKFVTLGPADCGCPDPKKESKTSSAKQAAPQTGLDDLYGGSGSGMGVPSMVPMPLPPIPVIP